MLDENSYSPLHAAASWGHADLLRYLVERGGDINLTDSDRETPLYVVENVAMAKLVVELGGDPRWTNEEGLTVRPPFSFLIGPLGTDSISGSCSLSTPDSRQHLYRKSILTSPCTSEV